MSFRSSGGPQPYSSTNLGSRPSGTTPGLNPPPPIPTSKPGSGAGPDGPGTNPPSVNPSKRDLFFNNSSSPATSLIQSINKNSTPMEPHKHGMVSNGNGSANGHGHEKFDKDKEKTQQKPSNKKTLDGYVGFANLPNQIYRKAVKRGFDFCVMVVGSSGLGKSTLINSMFLTDIYSSEEYPGPSVRSNKKTVKVESTQVLLKEKGVNLTLRIVDTPGFGDDVDNSNCWTPIVSSIESRYEDYLNAESRVNRQQRIPDSRVHVCLYFIPPTGHGLRVIDLEFMKRLHDKVNLVPIIGKADTLTGEEMAAFKKQILNELTQQKIKVYNFPDCDDEEENKVNKELRSRVPFAVVGSNTLIEIDGKKVRGRKYPWGTVQVENLEHNDFLALRNMILRTHLQDLKDVTNNVHYENYRCRKLAGIGPDGKELGGGSGEGTKAGGRAVLNGNSNLGSGNEKNPLAQMEEEKKSHYMKMKKMESEMEQVFEMKVKERNQRLADSEQDLKKRSEQMSKQLEKMRMDIDDKKRQFDLERSQWEKENGITLEDLKRLKDGKEYTDGSGKKPKKKGLF